MTGIAKSGPKRFYDAVDFKQGADGYTIHLDGKPVRTPARSGLAVATEELARQIVAEWSGQGKKIDPRTMPMTKRANTAIDRVRGREAYVVADIVSYAASDLLCYRADHPHELVDLQCALWDPTLRWAQEELRASFKTRTVITYVEQPPESLKRIGDRLSACDCFALTPLHTMTTLTGSALLVIALHAGQLNPEEVWAAAHVDEDWQISQWGEDEEAKARRAERKAEFDADCLFLELVRQ